MDVGSTDQSSNRHPEWTSESTQKFEWWSTIHMADISQSNCQLTTNDNWNNQRCSKLCSTFSFQFTNDEVESRYTSNWKLRTSKYLLSQTLEKNTTHRKWILGKITQRVHLDITRTKIMQKEVKKLSEVIVLLKEIIGQLPAQSRRFPINAGLYKLWDWDLGMQ